MRNYAKNFEVLIGTLLLLFAVLFIIAELEYIFRVRAHTPSLTVLQLIKNHLNDWQLGILSLISGIFLIFNKKNGWILGVSILIGLMILVLSNNIFYTTRMYREEQPNIYVTIGAVIFLIFLVGFLFSKHFRNKYKINSKDYLLISVIIMTMMFSEFII